MTLPKILRPSQEVALIGLLAAVASLLSVGGGLSPGAYIALSGKSAAGLGILMSISGVATLFAGIGAAILIDRGGQRIVLPLGCLVIAAAAVLFATGSGFPILLLAALLLGLGRGLVGVTIGLALVAKWVYRRRGMAMGFLLMFPLVASSAVGPGGLLLREAGSQLEAVVTTVAALIAAPVLYLFVPRGFPVLTQGAVHPLRRPYQDEAHLTGQGLRALPGFWKTIIVIGLLMVMAHVISLVANWNAITMIGHDSTTRDTVRTVQVILRISLALGTMAWGALADIRPARRFILIPTSLALLGLALAHFQDFPPLAISGLVLMGIGLGATRVLPWVLLADHLGTRYFAIVGTLLYLVAGRIGNGAGSLAIWAAGGLFGALWNGLIIGALTLTFAALVITAPRLTWDSTAPQTTPEKA